jgi:superfamily II DNA helicase RecQ
MKGHLICDWKSFRPEYGYLINITSFFPNVPLMILTATATVDVKSVFLEILRDPIQETSCVNRSNISLHAHELNKFPKKGGSFNFKVV